MIPIYQILQITEEKGNDYIPEIYIIYSSTNKDKATDVYDECLRYEREYSVWLKNMQNAYTAWYTKEFGNNKQNESYAFAGYMRWFKKATENNDNQKHIDFVNDYEKTNPFVTTATKYSEYTTFMFIESELIDD